MCFHKNLHKRFWFLPNYTYRYRYLFIGRITGFVFERIYYGRLCSNAKFQFHHHVVTLILSLLAWGYLLFSALGHRPSAPYASPRPTAPRPHKIFKCWFWLFICLCYKMLMCNISTFASSLSTDISEKQRLQLSWCKNKTFLWEIFTNKLYEQV